MRQPVLARNKECTGCMACVDTCKNQALSSYVGDDGHYYVKLHNNICIGCLACEKTCPVVNFMSYGESEYADFFAAWNKNDEERSRSASGGVFSAMAHFIIDHGGVVIGAATEDIYSVKHIVISEIDDIHKLQGSKYTQSDTTGIYDKTLLLLKEGNTVLFSGTGCQVAGLLSFIGKKRYSGKLITVDLICGGVPSKLLLQKFVENESYKVKKIISYRTKEKGWKPKGFVYNLKVEDSDGIVHDYTGKRNLVTTGFSTELTNRYSCYDCKFVGSNRISDFTIGDLWGDKEFPQEHFKGLSLVIIHNKNAFELLNGMKDYLSFSECDQGQAMKTNFRLVNGKNVRKHTVERRYLPSIFSHFNYKQLKKIYANDYPIYSPWMVLKTGRYLYLKLCGMFI